MIYGEDKSKKISTPSDDIVSVILDGKMSFKERIPLIAREMTPKNKNSYEALIRRNLNRNAISAENVNVGFLRNVLSAAKFEDYYVKSMMNKDFEMSEGVRKHVEKIKQITKDSTIIIMQKMANQAVRKVAIEWLRLSNEEKMAVAIIGRTTRNKRAFNIIKSLVYSSSEKIQEIYKNPDQKIHDINR